MVCIFNRLRGLLKTKLFADINSKLRKGSREASLWFLLYSLFLSPKSVSAVRLYGDETDIRRLCAFLSNPFWWIAKKVQTEKVMVCIFNRLRGLLKTKLFADINSKLRKGSREASLWFLLYSLFLSPKSVSAVRLYGDETDIRRFCAFLSNPFWWIAKKCRPKKWKWLYFHWIKRFIKV